MTENNSLSLNLQFGVSLDIQSHNAYDASNISSGRQKPSTVRQSVQFKLCGTVGNNKSEKRKREKAKDRESAVKKGHPQ
jgi:hypothetical protein